MAKLIDFNGDTYRLILSHRQRDDEVAEHFCDERDAYAFLKSHASDEINRAALRRFAVVAGFVNGLSTVADHQLIKFLAAKIASGELRVVRPGQRERRASAGTPKPGVKAEPAPPPEPTPPPPTTEKTWIKFEIVDEKTGKPVSGVTLKVKLPDGETRSVTSNSVGIIEIMNIPPGTCDIERMLDSESLEVVSIK